MPLRDKKLPKLAKKPKSANDFGVGQVVKSKSGRDKGRMFLVFEVLDEEYMLIVDGKLRGVERPKKKKYKHLKNYDEFCRDFYNPGLTIRANNTKIKEYLCKFIEEE